MEFLLKLSQKKIEIFIGNYGLKETIGFVQLTIYSHNQPLKVTTFHQPKGIALIELN
jgi:hypothetical protein